MENWGTWELSPQAEELLNKICSKLDPGGISKDWLELLNYDHSEKSDTCQMEVDKNSKEEEIVNFVKECIKSETVITEQTLTGISNNGLDRVLKLIESVLDDSGFCFFCKCIAAWTDDNLIEYCLRLVILPKLKEIKDASACVTFAIKELGISKPDKLSRSVLVPLLTDMTYKLTDVELLSEVLLALPDPEKDFVIRKYTSKEEFIENDWLLLYLVIKDLSQNSLLSLLECVQKFSDKFKKSQVFGRFLVNFCKNIESECKDILREVVENHETLLKTQAKKFLESL